MIRQFELVERVHSYDPEADEDMLNRAYVYGLQKHGSQLRASGDPYFSHPVEVAGILAEMRLDTSSIITGLLHDTLEDTDTTYEDLVQRFGREVAALVAEVTDDKSLRKEERKRLQIEKTPGKSRRAKLLKLADKTSNLRSLVQSPPKGWTEERMRDYVQWAEAVVSSCRGLNARLEAGFDAAHRDAKARFGA
jgi:GTP pyrophosphokinase